MLKKQPKSSALHSSSLAILFLCVAALASCDRGATEQIQAAERFADATARNNVSLRDSMIATRLFKSYFKNEYVSSEFITWIQSLYDFHNHKFTFSANADVDRDLKADLKDGLIDPSEIEETGIVKVGSRNEPDQAAYFYMVKQKGQHWKVAMVTKGEAQVNFNNVSQ